jgi:hypothetical protein
VVRRVGRQPARRAATDGARRVPVQPADTLRGHLRRTTGREPQNHGCHPAPANRIGCEPDGRVTDVDVRDASKRIVPVTAADTVLAAGSLETARLPLASDDVQPSGFGNALDLAGRFLMERPIVWEVPTLFLGRLTDVEFFGVSTAEFTPATHRWRGHFMIDAESRRRHGLLAS